MESLPPFTVEVPEFKSDVPAFLLEDASPKDRYFLETLSKLSQAQIWQTQELIRGGEVRNQIATQVKIANGRTAKNEEAIKVINDLTIRIDREMEPVRFVSKWGSNKYVLLGVAVLILVGIPFVASLGLTFGSFTGLFTAIFGA